MIAMVAGAIGSLPLSPALARRLEGLRRAETPRVRVAFETALAVAQILALGAIFAVSAMLMAAGTYSPFIYYRF
jgi:hypothetical protein